MTRLLLVGLAAAGLATAGFAQTTTPTPTGTVTGNATTQTNPTGTTGTGSATTQTTVPGVGGATTTGNGMIQVPNQFGQPGLYGQQGVYGQQGYGQQGVYGQPYTTTYPYGVNPYQQQGVMTAGYNGMQYGGVMQTGGYGQGPVAGALASGDCGGCSSGYAAPMYQQSMNYASTGGGCCGKKKRGLFRR